MDIGIFGGSFNPIHLGHLVAAEEVFQQLALSKVVFVPTGISPHKEERDLIGAFHRYQMVKEAIHDNEHFEISDIEIKRPGKSYTIDTVRMLKEGYGENHTLYLIVGTDMIAEINTWKDIDALSRMCRFAVVNRSLGSKQENSCAGREEAGDVSSRGGMEMVAIKVTIPPIGISSTDIRDRLRGKRSIRYLVPMCVEEYIKVNNLYVKI